LIINIIIIQVFVLHLSKTISNKLEAKKEIRIIKVYIFLKICLGLYPNKIATQNRDREKEKEKNKHIYAILFFFSLGKSWIKI